MQLARLGGTFPHPHHVAVLDAARGAVGRVNADRLAPWTLEEPSPTRAPGGQAPGPGASDALTEALAGIARSAGRLCNAGDAAIRLCEGNQARQVAHQGL